MMIFLEIIVKNKKYLWQKNQRRAVSNWWPGFKVGCSKWRQAWKIWSYVGRTLRCGWIQREKCVSAGIYKWGSFGEQPYKWTVFEALPILRRKVKNLYHRLYILIFLYKSMRMVSRVFLKLAVKSLRFRRHTIPFLKIHKNDISMKSKRWKSEEGTWSMSSLIPHREDIIPRWSQLLTTLFSRGMENP